MPRVGYTVDDAAGVREKIVQIEQNAPGTAGSGMPTETWTALGVPVFMNRTDQLADERFAADQESAWSVAHWCLPYQSNMDPELVDVTRLRRLNFNGRIFNIRAASLSPSRSSIELTTLAKVD